MSHKNRKRNKSKTHYSRERESKCSNLGAVTKLTTKFNWEIFVNEKKVTSD